MQPVELIFIPFKEEELQVNCFVKQEDSIIQINNQEELDAFKNGIMKYYVVKPYFISVNNVKEEGDECICLDEVNQNKLLENENNQTNVFVKWSKKNNCNGCRKIMATPEQIGYIYTDDNINNKEPLVTYYRVAKINDLKTIMANDGICAIDAIEYCPNYNGSHKNKDCSCKSGFAHYAKLLNNKVIIHLNAI